MIRPALPEELDSICSHVTTLEPWTRLGIEAEAMARKVREDALRRILILQEHGVTLGAIMFRSTHGAELLFGHGFGPALAALFNHPWPCDWADLPDGGYISCLAVFPLGRGRGLGSALLAAAEDHIDCAGTSIAWLMVSDWNARARSLYERQGYNQITHMDNVVRPGNREHLLVKRI